MPMNRDEYPEDWEDISQHIRFARAGGRCEGTPRYPRCQARHGHAHPETGSRVILTTAHMDHDKTNNTEENLRALCQRCHLDHDRDRHIEKASRTRVERKETAGQNRLDLKIPQPIKIRFINEGDAGSEEDIILYDEQLTKTLPQYDP